MIKFIKILINKGQPKSCPLLFNTIFIIIIICILPACSKKKASSKPLTTQEVLEEKLSTFTPFLNPGDTIQPQNGSLNKLPQSPLTVITGKPVELDTEKQPQDSLDDNAGKPTNTKTAEANITVHEKTIEPEDEKVQETEPMPLVEVKKTHYKTFVNQARNIDISTPVGFKLVKSDSQNETNFFVYHGNQKLEKVTAYYTRELEILGWEFKNLSTKQEGLFSCNKSSKTCIISIRPNETCGSIICITVTNAQTQD